MSICFLAIFLPSSMKPITFGTCERVSVCQCAMQEVVPQPISHQQRGLCSCSMQLLHSHPGPQGSAGIRGNQPHQAVMSQWKGSQGSAARPLRWEHGGWRDRP